MAFAPAGSAAFFRGILPERIGLLETVAPSFGECLFHAATSLLDAGPRCRVPAQLRQPDPARRLSRRRRRRRWPRPATAIVLGPSTDGGYYLIGLKRPHRRLFEDIDWSTERVAAQTLARARELDLAVHHLPSWYDVDDVDALRLLMGELIEDRRFRVWGSKPTPATWTRRELARLLDRAPTWRRGSPLRCPASLVA